MEESEQTAEKLTASVNVLNVVMTKLAEELGREPNLSEIAAKMQMSEDEVTFTFGGATVKAGNSQNGRFQDMYCGEITLTLLQAQMKRLVKEGMK